jgi:50S ribosomal subunit-associated GTPase HflX
MDIIEISAKEEKFFSFLLDKISKVFLTNEKSRILNPYTDQSSVALLIEGAKVLQEEYKEEGTLL